MMRQSCLKLTFSKSQDAPLVILVVSLFFFAAGNGADGEAFLSLAEEEIKELVSSIGERRKLINRQKKLKVRHGVYVMWLCIAAYCGEMEFSRKFYRRSTMNKRPRLGTMSACNTATSRSFICSKAVSGKRGSTDWRITDYNAKVGWNHARYYVTEIDTAH